MRERTLIGVRLRLTATAQCIDGEIRLQRQMYFTSCMFCFLLSNFVVGLPQCKYLITAAGVYGDKIVDIRQQSYTFCCKSETEGSPERSLESIHKGVN